MDLKTYLSKLSLKEREAFAERCGSSAKHLRNVSYGYRPCAEQLAIEIEKNTERTVTCEELRPDVDWAYLRGTRRLKTATQTAA